MFCLDDKHRMKIGEPGFPVAAAERGRRVMVKVGSSFDVADHDFTKFSMIPSVVLMNNILQDITESWYRGKVYVSLKDAAFEYSSPIRHMTELSSILSSLQQERKIVLLYTDGGPDHRVTFLSVQLALIALFLKHDLDFLCAARTAPCHSWSNPVERIMSTLNLGLQCVGLMREKMDDEFEKTAQRCKSLKDLRKKATESADFKSMAIDSVSHVKSLLARLFGRLELKEEKFTILNAASDKNDW